MDEINVNVNEYTYACWSSLMLPRALNQSQDSVPNQIRLRHDFR